MGKLKYAELLPEMQKLRDLGLTYRDIGKKLGVNDTTIVYYLNPEQRDRDNDALVRSRRAVRARLLALYGGKCSECGESTPEVLQLNHIHGGGRKERKTSSHGVHTPHNILKGKKNKDDYNLLCANCNILYEYKVGKKVQPGPSHLAAILKIGDKCAECGITDMRVLQINHLNGGGGKDQRYYGSGSLGLHRAIVSGRRNTNDLNILCANHNVLFKPNTWAAEDEGDEKQVVILSQIAQLRARIGGRHGQRA